MKLLNTLNQNINLPISYIQSNDFKDNFVDKLLDIRDDISDRHGVFPVLAVSSNTYTWLKRLFGFEITFLEVADGTFFWGMRILQLDMRDGLFDFYLEENE